MRVLVLWPLTAPRRIANQYLSIVDTSSATYVGNVWDIAVARGDSAAVRELRERVRAGDPRVVTSMTAGELARRALERGLPLADARDVLIRLLARATYTDSFEVEKATLYTTLATGQARNAAAMYLPGGVGCGADAFLPGGDAGCGPWEWQFLITLGLTYPGLDSIAALVVDSLRHRVTTHPADFASRCHALLYSVQHGDTVGARSQASALTQHYRGDNRLGICPALVHALVESQAGPHDDAPALDSLEALLRHGTWSELPVHAGMLIVGRLRRQRGEYDAGLRAIRDFGPYGLAIYYSTRTAYLKEEGTLAALTGDTAGAISAFRTFLTFKTEPDPGVVQAEVDSVRAALARLTAESP